MNARIGEINRQILDIFTKHKIKPPIGEEAFWNIYEDLLEDHPEDAEELERLGQEWRSETISNNLH